MSFAVISNKTCYPNLMADCHATATMKTSKDDQPLMKTSLFIRHFKQQAQHNDVIT